MTSQSQLQTVFEKEVVEDLEERETVPRVRRLLLQDAVHIDTEEREEDLRVTHHLVRKPRERLHVIMQVV